MVVRVIYDHNVMDGRSICGAFHELRRVLDVQILAEPRALPAGGVIAKWAGLPIRPTFFCGCGQGEGRVTACGSGSEVT